MRWSLKLALVAACSLAAIFAPPSEVDAKPNRTSGDTSGGTVNVAAGSARVSSGGGGGSGPRCTWTPATVGEIIDFGGQGPNPGPTLTPEERNEQTTVTGTDGDLLSAFFVKCPGEPVRLELIDTSITVADLAALAYQEASGIIPVPAHDMNPRPEVGSFVNLGLWLAVEDQAVPPITAEAGNVWITAHPELINATFKFGNGDVENCNGLGVPYEEGSNTFDPSPTCGYVYTQRGTFTITITTTWTIPYESSNGPGTIEPAIETETPFDYQVKEIQTVGTGN